MARLRIVFMGTPDLAAVCLEALLAEPGFEILAAVTQPDRPKGRDLKLQPSPVKQLALRVGVPVLQPLKARDEDFFHELSRLTPDLIAVAAFGQLLPPRLLELPRYGCVNVHTSLLPKYRGAAPIQWSIAQGDEVTGVTIMKMDVGMDTGDILTQESAPITPTDNSQTLHDRLAQLGAALLVRTLPPYVAGSITPRPQDAALATHAPKIKKEDGHLDWRLPATILHHRLRAFTPWPGTFTFLPAAPHPVLLKIWEAGLMDASGAPGTVLQADKHGLVIACGVGAWRILTLQREGGRRLGAAEFLAGHPLKVGDTLH